MVAFRCFIMDRCKFILTLGLIIAQFNETQKASSLANIVNMVLAILGGLWFPIQTFRVGYKEFQILLQHII